MNDAAILPRSQPGAIAIAREPAAGESVRSLRCGRLWLDTRAVEAYDEDMSGDARDAPRARNVLIVANRTAATPALLAEVGRRASEGVCRFTLLVPRPYWDADTEESAITLELAIPLLEDAAGGRVEGLVGSEDPFLAVSAALEAGSYDEVIISTLPARVSHWLHLDLPARVQRLGLPVSVVTAKKADRPLARSPRRSS
jgi:hypothetical protein